MGQYLHPFVSQNCVEFGGCEFLEIEQCFFAHERPQLCVEIEHGLRRFGHPHFRLVIGHVDRNRLFQFVGFVTNLFGSGFEHGADTVELDAKLGCIDTQTILGEVAKTGRLVTVEENPRLCGWGAEISSIVAEEMFYDLDGPIQRITTPHIPLASADELEDLMIPSVDRIYEEVRKGID